MKTIITFCLSLLFFTQISVAQNKSVHKIIFQLQTGDTTAHKVLMKQCTNILNVAPGSQIEVVCHGPGLEMMMIEKSIVASKLKVLKEQGVVFNVCEFSMKERKIEHSKFIEQATFVPAGIIEIVTKQEQGWSYIKAGL